MNAPHPQALRPKALPLLPKSAAAFARKCLHFLPIALLLLALNACSTRKHAIADRENEAATPALSSTQARQMLEQQSLAWSGSYSAKTRFNFTLGQKTFSLSGTLRLKHNEALQISLQVPLLGMEAARIEVSPQRILVLDRIHKKYVEEPIERLSSLSGTGLDFYSLQALLTATLFRPGIKDFTLADAEALQFSDRAAANLYRLSASERGLNYSFDLNAADQRIASAAIAKAGSRYACTWQYGGYQTTGSRAFPTRIQARFDGGKVPLAVELGFNKLEPSDWKPDAAPSSRYQRIELADVLKLLSAL